MLKSKPRSSMTPCPSLIHLIREDWTSHWGELTRPGFQALAVYRLQCWAERQARRPMAALFRPIIRAMAWSVRHRYDIDIHPFARLGRRLQIGHQGGIVIGADVQMGDDCIIMQGVRIGADSKTGDGAPRLGDRVRIGARAVVDGPVRIGSDARLGPNAVVTTDVGVNAVAIAPPVTVSRPQH